MSIIVAASVPPPGSIALLRSVIRTYGVALQLAGVVGQVGFAAHVGDVERPSRRRPRLAAVLWIVRDDAQPQEARPSWRPVPFASGVPTVRCCDACAGGEQDGEASGGPWTRFGDGALVVRGHQRHAQRSRALRPRVPGRAP